MLNEFNIIGHRGNRKEFNENTIAGISSVLQDRGIDGVEIDIVSTHDKKLILSHDLFLKDHDNKKYFINKKSYLELLKLTENIDGKLSVEQRRYPLLEEIIKLFSEKKEGKKLFIEIKSLPSDNYFSISMQEILESVHFLIRKYNIVNNCYIISFDYRFIKKSSILNNNIKTGMILHRNIIPLELILKDLKLAMLIMEKDWISKECIREAKKYNVDIYTWTPNTEKDWQRLINLGVKGLITDNPKKLLEYKKRMEKK